MRDTSPPANPVGTAEPETPLSRNRNYHILWASQLLSESGKEIAFVAFPLLVLASSGSPLLMGVASSILAAASVAASVPAGVLADRVDRKNLMLLCEGLRALGLASIAFVQFAGSLSFTHIVIVAALEGALGSVFEPAEHAALPQVVPRSQLANAVARNTARPFIAILLGPALAGLAFAAHPALPFAVEALALTASFLVLLLLRLPPRTAEQAPRQPFRAMTEGFRWALGRRTIRSTLIYSVFVNLAFHAVILLVLAISGEDDVGPGQIGLTMACLGAGGLLGGLFAAKLHAALPAPLIVIGFAWVAAVMTALMVTVPRGLPLGLLLAGAAFLAPLANATVVSYQLMVTPDELRGRLSGISALGSGAAGAVGPLVTGSVLALTGSGTTSIVVCAAAMALIAAGATLSPTLRRFPTVRTGNEDHRA